MLLWDYIEESSKLCLRLCEGGKTYRVVQDDVKTAKQLAFWLKHYERLDRDTFIVVSSVTK